MRTAHPWSLMSNCDSHSTVISAGRYTMLERCRSISASWASPASLPPRRLKRPRSLSAKSAPPPFSSEPNGTLTQTIPIAIVGAGPAGLTLSSLLSRFGVPSILLEKALALPTHPQAHFINVRTMEIMRHALGGLDKAIMQRCPPRAEWRDFVVCSSVLGRQLARVDNFSQAETEGRDRLSPTDVAHLSQNVLLPLLLKDARQAAARWCPSTEIVFHAEATGLRRNPNSGLENDAPPLELFVRRGKNNTRWADTSARPAEGESSSAEIDKIGCDYVVAADGAGSTVRAAAGIGLRGRRELGHLMNVHFRCKDLGRVLRHRGQQAGMLSFVYNEETISVLVAHNVQKGEWACQIPFFPPHQTAEWFTEERCLSLVQHAIGPGAKSLHIHISSVRPWTMNALVADKYFEPLSSAADGTETSRNEGDGGVFLMGDAAHQFPPAGGFGLNTGIQDAHNLAWKLAAVYHGHRPEVLYSYEQERRPVAMRNAALSVRNLKRSLRVVEALGVNPDVGASKLIMGRLVRSPMALKWSDGVTRVATSIWKPQERSENILRLGRRQLQALRREGHPYGDARVRVLRRLLAEGGGLPLLFPEHDVGFTYCKGAVLPPPENLDDSEGLAAASSPVNGPSSSESSGGPSEMNSPRSRILVGGIMPHFLLRPACDDDGQTEVRQGGGDRPVVGNTRVPPGSLFSTVDLPDQLRLSSRRNRARYPRKRAVGHVEDGGSKAICDDPAGRFKVDQAARETSRVSLASVLLIAPPQTSSPPKSQTLGDGSEFLSTENKFEMWRPIAFDVQQDLAASAAGRKNVAIPCPLVIVTAVPAIDDVSKDGTDRRVRSGDAPPTSSGELVRRHASNHHDSTRFVGSAVGDAPMGLEVLARIDEWWPLYPPAAMNAAEDSTHSHLSGVLLLAMRAVDASGGALGRAFAEADAEAVLIRPDGHIGWAAPRGTALGKQGDARQSLTEALKTVYSGKNVIDPPELPVV